MARLKAALIAGVAALLMSSGMVVAGVAPTTVHAAPVLPSAAAATAHHLRPGVTPIMGSHGGATQPPAAQSSAFSAQPHVAYYGGKVVASIHVVEVLYGGGTYRPYVLNTVTPNIKTFYTGITSSTYVDLMSEYDTNINAINGQPGTNQAIVRGTFAGPVQITPSPANSGTTVDDTAIQRELTAQVTAGHLSPDGNTLFAVYFPAGVTITVGGAASGAQFCAYHGTVPSPEMYYSVLPDFSTGAMTSGCGPTTNTEFQDVTAVSSHEFAEVITDPEVGLPTVPTCSTQSNCGPPVAWYDVNNNAENGDLCNQVDGTTTGGDGVTYTVQKIWSNQQNTCVLAPAPPPPPPPPPRFSPQGVGAPQVAVTPDGGTQLVFWKASNNQLAEAWYSGYWNGPITFPQLGSLVSTPSVAVTKDGSRQQLVFWEGPGGHLFEAWYAGSWNGPVDWTAAWGGRGLLASAPSVVTTAHGEQLVFWRGTDGHLWEAWYTGVWNGPVDFSGLGTLASAPSAAQTPNGVQQLVFWQGVDNRLTEVWYQGSWNGPVEWTGLGSISSPPSVAVTPDGSTQLVFYRSPGGHLLESWYAGSWNGPVDWTASAFGGNGLLASSPSAAVMPDNSQQLVFWQGAGATLWEGWYAGGSWHGPVNFSAG
jgi:hypothetical protein